MPGIEHDSNLTAAPAEKMRELSGVLRLIKQGRAGQVIYVNFRELPSMILNLSTLWNPD